MNIDKNIRPLNDKGQRHGLCEYYWENGNPSNKVNFLNGKRNGLFEDYNSNGNLICKGNYINNKKIGFWEYYNYNGEVWLKYYCI